MKKSHQITKSHIITRLDKHHIQEFYFLPSRNEYVIIASKSGLPTKRIGPAIIQVDQRGICRTICRHPINGPQIWAILLGYMEAGVWALSDRHVAPLLPAHLLRISKRFFDINDQRRSRMLKNTQAELKNRRKVRQRRNVKSR